MQWACGRLRDDFVDILQTGDPPVHADRRVLSFADPPS